MAGVDGQRILVMDDRSSTPDGLQRSAHEEVAHRIFWSDRNHRLVVGDRSRAFPALPGQARERLVGAVQIGTQFECGLEVFLGLSFAAQFQQRASSSDVGPVRVGPNRKDPTVRVDCLFEAPFNREPAAPNATVPNPPVATVPPNRRISVDIP